ncbi:MAG: TolC family protein [Bacteroidota bacterium]
MKRIRILITALLVSSATVLFAQQTAGDNVWTLRGCIDRALENNLTVKRSQLNVQSNDINLQQSKLALLPTVNGSASTGYLWGRSIDPTTNLFVTERINSAGFGANSSVTLFNGMRLRNSIKQSQSNFEASQYDLKKTEGDVVLSVVTFYTNVIFNKELLDNAKLQLGNTEQQLQQVEKQVEVGALPISNKLDLMAQKASNEANVINQQNALNLSLLQLKQALQIPSSQPFDIEVPQIDLDNVTIPELTADEIYDIALGRMPEVKSADLGVESADLGIQIAKGNLYPRLSLNAAINTNFSSAADRARFIPDGGPDIVIQNPEVGFVEGTNQRVFSNDPITIPSGSFSEGFGFRDQFDENLSRSIGVSLAIPVFNGLSARAGVQRAAITNEQAKITAEETRNTLRQAIETAYSDVLAAAQSYSAALRQVAAQEESFRMMQQRNVNNAVSPFDFQIAQNDLNRARTDLVRAKYDYIFKQKVLDFYQGKPIEF